MAWDLAQYQANVAAGLIPANAHLFADDAAFQTLDKQGDVMPNQVGVVYSIPENPPDGLPIDPGDPRLAPLSVYVNIDKTAPGQATVINTDDNGYLVPFCAPPGVNRVWVDFGEGRVMLTASDLADQIENIDPLEKPNPWQFDMTQDDFGMVVKGIPDSLAQIFQVRDPYDAPIFSVGHTGGPAAYGDHMSVYDGSFNLKARMGLDGTLTLNGKVLTAADIDAIHSSSTGSWVPTTGGGIIYVGNGNTTTQSLAIRIPAGDRTTANAPDTMAFYFNTGTDASPNWQRTSFFNEFGEFRVIPSATTRTPMRVKALSGQTANLQEWTDLNNVATSWVDASGGGHFTTLKVNETPVATNHNYLPADYGLSAWNGDPGYLAGSLAVPAGVIRLLKIKVPKAMTISKVAVMMAGGSVSLTSGQNYVALYDTSGNRVAVSADATAQWAATTAAGTLMQTSLTASYSAAAGFIYAAILFNGTSPPNMGRFGQNPTYANLGTTQMRFASYGTSQTSMPTSITPASMAADPTACFWAGVS